MQGAATNAGLTGLVYPRGFAAPTALPTALAPRRLSVPKRVSLLTCAMDHLLPPIRRILTRDLFLARAFGHATLQSIPAEIDYDAARCHPERYWCTTCGTSPTTVSVQRGSNDRMCSACWARQPTDVQEAVLRDATLVRHASSESITLLEEAALTHTRAVLARTAHMEDLVNQLAAAPTAPRPLEMLEEFNAGLSAWAPRLPDAGAPLSPLAPLEMHIDDISARPDESNAKILRHLSHGIPVKISGLSVDKAQWHPSKILEKRKKVDILKLTPTEWLSREWSVQQFVNAYEENGNVKLKDFPADASFQDECPELFAEFIAMLNTISPDLLNPKGLFNMLRVHTGGVDPGPKLYCATGTIERNSRIATATLLHMDIAGAINILVEGLGDGPFAVWVIFPRESTAGLLDYLRSAHGSEDPFVSRDVCLRPDDLDELKRRGVLFWEVEQSVGDAILVAMGSAHQVWNLDANTKIASDMALVCDVEEFMARQETMRGPDVGLDVDVLGTSQMVLRATCEIVRELNALMRTA